MRTAFLRMTRHMTVPQEGFQVASCVIGSKFFKVPFPGLTQPISTTAFWGPTAIPPLAISCDNFRMSLLLG